MCKILFYILTVSLVLLTISPDVLAQEGDKNKDSFFLAKKKGLLGRLGQSISTNVTDVVPQDPVKRFLRYKGKIIRSIEPFSLDFGQDINDTTELEKNFGTKVANQIGRASCRERVC